MKRYIPFTARYLLRSRTGTAAVEFALLSPALLLLLFAMIAYGIYFGASHSVQQISADAARTAIAGLSQEERQALVAGFISRNAGGYPFINLRGLEVEARDSTADGSQFTVQLRYDAGNLPIWSLLRGLSLPGQTIVRTSTIRIGGL